MTLNSLDYPPSTVASPLPEPEPAPKKRLPKWAWLSLAGVLITGGGYFGWQQLTGMSQAAQRPMIAPVERTNLTMTVSANGTIAAEQVVNVSPKTAGVLTKLLVKEGDRVTKGQAIAQMDDSNLQGPLRQAQAQLAQQEVNLTRLLNGNRAQEIAQSAAQLAEAQAKLQQLQAGNRWEDVSQAQARLNQAQAKFHQAEDDLTRFKALYSAGAISQQTANQKQAERDKAQAEVNEMQSALALQQRGARSEEIAQARSLVEQRQQAFNLLKAGARSEDIDTARTQVESAKGVLQTVQAQINDTTIRAAFTGLVTRKYADPGAFVTPTTAGSSVSSATSSSILSLASTNQAVANVSESNIAQIKLGQTVEVTADAYPGKVFQGKVSQISAQAIVQQNVTSFEVKVALTDDAERLLRSGMNVAMKFNVGQLDNVMTVPTVAITRQQNATGVFVGAPGQPPKFLPITTGATIDKRTEVKSGLTGAEKVLIQMPPQSKPKSWFSFPGLDGSSKDGPPGGGPPPSGPPGGGSGGGPPAGSPPGR